MTAVGESAAAARRPSDVELGRIAAWWREQRRLYSIYSEINRRFQLGEPCPDLQSPINRIEAEVWFKVQEERVDASHLRQVLQTSGVADEESLRLLILRLLRKPQPADGDRDKIDFLLVQYLSQCVPYSFRDTNFRVQDVARILESVLGETSTVRPAWLGPLEGLVVELKQCSSLADLLERGILERARALKVSGGAMYFGSAPLLSFTRFNFLMRHAFFWLMYADLEAIPNGARELEKRGVRCIDARAAGLSATEPVVDIRIHAESWKETFRLPYNSGTSFAQVPALRAVVEKALRECGPQPTPYPELTGINAPEQVAGESYTENPS